MSRTVPRILLLNIGKPSNGDIATRPESVALREVQPDYVVFVCSQPAKTQAAGRDYVDTYAQLAGLSPDQFELLELPDPDDLAECYQKLVQCLEDLRHRFPGAELLADYTAGTKSMSAALVLAALDDEQSPEVKLRLVRGERGQQATVIPGTESSVAVSGIHDLRARRLVSRARDALERFDYAEAHRLLGQALQREISSSLRDQLVRVRNLCRAFDAWDRYELDQAAKILQNYRQNWCQWLGVLEELQGVTSAFAATQHRQPPDQPRLAGLDHRRDPYVAVEDLLLNAERRAAQHRYDDAMARIYRALELLVQLRLWLGHRIDTSNTDLSRLPETLREQ
ncbi:MAG: TIGR02710 family CRISPR-associated CARF protein, partial [Thermomicrobium sp.]